MPGRGREEIDAAGLLVTPGFVDIHTHYDGQATWDSRVTPSSWHGVTTAVMGNCGVGFAPVRPDAHDRLISLMEGVEDIPGAVLEEGIDWSWESFGEYLDAVERRPHDIDLCAQLPHGALRLYVMGERAARLEDATGDDMAAMRRLATEALSAGAIGFSTSRTLNHRTATGDPTPSLRARADELEAIALGVADAGHGVVELISDFWPDPDAEFAMIRQPGRAHGLPPVGLAGPEPPAARGVARPAGADCAGGGRRAADPGPGGAPAGGAAARAAVLVPSLLGPPRVPRGRRAAARGAGGRAARPRLPGPPARRASDRTAPCAASSTTAACTPWAKCPTTSRRPRRACSGMAEARGVDPAELTMDLLAENGGRNFLFVPFSNYADGHLDACGEMLAHPDTVFGLGDGGAHVGIIADASFPTYALTHWARDRSHGRMPVGWVVAQLTSSTARAVGLHDRGVLAPGMRADLNVIDFDRLRCEAPVMAYDLPAGGKRLLQRARGYRATIVARAGHLSRR